MTKGRPSLLVDRQWRELRERHQAGESGRALAAEFGISEAAVRKFLARPEKVLPAVVVDMPKAVQVAEMRAVVMVDAKPKDIDGIAAEIAAAASLNASTANKLAAIAAQQIGCIDAADPMATADVLQGLAALIKLSNEAGSAGLNLLGQHRRGLGKKDGQRVAAEDVAAGKFGARQPPKLVASK